jgi:hypothetical protein
VTAELENPQRDQNKIDEYMTERLNKDYKVRIEYPAQIVNDASNNYPDKSDWMSRMIKVTSPLYVYSLMNVMIALGSQPEIDTYNHQREKEQENIMRNYQNNPQALSYYEQEQLKRDSDFEKDIRSGYFIDRNTITPLALGALFESDADLDQVITLAKVSYDMSDDPLHYFDLLAKLDEKGWLGDYYKAITKYLVDQYEQAKKVRYRAGLSSIFKTPYENILIAEDELREEQGHVLTPEQIIFIQSPEYKALQTRALNIVLPILVQHNLSGQAVSDAMLNYQAYLKAKGGNYWSLY